MEPPEFPEEFVLKHCRQVERARRSIGRHEALSDGDLAGFAECTFTSAGAGLKCESCSLFMTRPFCGYKLDEEWLPRIEQYYRDLATWEQHERDEAAIAATHGAYI